jgi:hypothetical protein
MTTQTLPNALDLSKDFPRSPNAPLGHYVLLPRIIDKGRAVIAGTQGEYKYNCPLDRQFFDFTQIDAEAFKAELAAGKSDEELLAWVQSHATQHDDSALLEWSYQQRWRRPAGESAGYFEALRLQIAPNNYQLETWFQLLDTEEKRL